MAWEKIMSVQFEMHQDPWQNTYGQGGRKEGKDCGNIDI